MKYDSCTNPSGYSGNEHQKQWSNNWSRQQSLEVWFSEFAHSLLALDFDVPSHPLAFTSLYTQQSQAVGQAQRKKREEMANSARKAASAYQGDDLREIRECFVENSSPANASYHQPGSPPSSLRPKPVNREHSQLQPLQLQPSQLQPLAANAAPGEAHIEVRLGQQRKRLRLSLADCVWVNCGANWGWWPATVNGELNSDGLYRVHSFGSDKSYDDFPSTKLETFSLNQGKVSQLGAQLPSAKDTKDSAKDVPEWEDAVEQARTYLHRQRGTESESMLKKREAAWELIRSIHDHSCAICLNQWGEEDVKGAAVLGANLVQTPCDHFFCQNCFGNYEQTQTRNNNLLTCPRCCQPVKHNEVYTFHVNKELFAFSELR